MKTKLLLATIFAFSFFNAFSQNNFPKGSLLAGGSVNFYTGKNELSSSVYDRYTGFSIFPSMGIAVRPNLFAGLTLGYTHFRQRNYSPDPMVMDSLKTSTYNYGLFLRKYKPLKYNFSIFLQADLGGFNSTFRSTAVTQGYATTSKTFGTNLSLTPGISYGINSRLQIEAGLNNIAGIGYSQTENFNPQANPDFYRKESSLNITTSLSNFNSQLFFGFRLLLQKKDKMVASK